jgi:hypothetical protein
MRDTGIALLLLLRHFAVPIAIVCAGVLIAARTVIAVAPDGLAAAILLFGALYFAATAAVTAVVLAVGTAALSRPE